MGMFHFLFKQCFLHVRKFGKRQTADASIPTHQIHRMFNRDWIDITEQCIDQAQQLNLECRAFLDFRSEERRVGKECRL